MLCGIQLFWSFPLPCWGFGFLPIFSKFSTSKILYCFKIVRHHNRSIPISWSNFEPHHFSWKSVAKLTSKAVKALTHQYSHGYKIHFIMVYMPSKVWSLRSTILDMSMWEFIYTLRTLQPYTLRPIFLPRLRWAIRGHISCSSLMTVYLTLKTAFIMVVIYCTSSHLVYSRRTFHTVRYPDNDPEALM